MGQITSYFGRTTKEDDNCRKFHRIKNLKEWLDTEQYKDLDELDKLKRFSTNNDYPREYEEPEGKNFSKILKKDYKA